MDEENTKRTDIEDLPRAEEELSDDEAKNVQGGLTKTGAGTLGLSGPNVRAPGNTIGGALGSTTGNTVGGSLGIDPSDPSTKMGDGSV